MARHENLRPMDFKSFRPKRGPDLTSEDIAAHTAAFLDSGGRIEHVPIGATGVAESGHRPLVIKARTNVNCT